MSDPVLADSELEALFRPMAVHAHWGLAVSGGRDSMALMLLAARHVRSAGRDAELTVLTVDHGLRPEAAREAAFVAEAAAGLGLRQQTLHWRGPRPASGLQAAAREARYDLMADYALARGIGCLATAHQLEDQAETVLMRLKRGSGLDGLAGIPAEGRWGGLPVFRPLLDIPRARLETELEVAGMAWIDDPSNEEDRFERVRVRKAMQELARLGYSAQALATAARRMRRASEALDAATQDFLARYASMTAAGYGVLDHAALAAAPEEIVLRATARTIEAVRGGEADVALARLETLTASLRGENFEAATLGGCRFIRRGTDVLALRETGRRNLHEFGLRPGERRLWDRRFRVSAPASAEGPVTVRALGERGARQVRARVGRAVELPEAAAVSLVSFWRGEELVAVPPLGFHAAGEGRAGAVYEARFVNEDVFSRGRP